MPTAHFSGLNFGDTHEIKRVARLHHEAPLDWIDGYEVSEAAVDETYKVMLESGQNPRTHVIVARDADDGLVGFHWISLDKEDETSARIESLWVAEAHRRQGVARQLKRLGETWMKERGAKQVRTSVFYVNKKMIAFNVSEGFTPGQLEMTKKL